VVGKKKDPEILPFDVPEQYELLAEFTVLGEPGRKSNQRRIVKNKRTDKPMIIKSQKAMSYQSSFLKQITGALKNKWGSRDELLLVWAHVYYASNRPDLSAELLTDLLQQAEIISNDRWIKSHVLFGSVDKENPRTEFRLYRLK